MITRARDWSSAHADALVLLGLLVLAALFRLPNLATRGTWDADQGHDMLVLRTFVQDPVAAFPLLGPPTSIGDVHHGAWYYYLLSPAAFVTGGDSPLAVVGLIALAGIAAVGVVWWLARSVGGPVAGVVAGLVMAVSTAALDESTFIWNPNLIALSSAIALAGAWHVSAMAALKRMGKADPLLRHAYMRHIRYRPFYPARSGLYSRCLQPPMKWL